MAYIKLRVNDANAEAEAVGDITAGAIGIKVYVTITGDRWENLHPMLIMSNGKDDFKSMIKDGEAEIPDKLLIAGKGLRLGVDGLSADGNLRIPTIWATAGSVKRSVDSANPVHPTPPAPDVIAQILSAAEDANRKAQTVLNAYESGELNGKDGTPGPQGPQGPKGDTYDDTKIKDAVSEIKQGLTQCEQTKVGYSEVVNGQLLMYSDATKENLLATLDLPGGGVTDVQVAGESVVQDGIANIPGASETTDGVVKVQGDTWFGVTKNRENVLYISKATQSHITGRSNEYNPIVPSNLVYSFDSVLCSTAESEQLTEEQQAAARQRLGLNDIGVKIADTTLEEITDVLSIDIPEDIFPNGCEGFDIFFYVKSTNTTNYSIVTGAVFDRNKVVNQIAWLSGGFANNTYSHVRSICTAQQRVVVSDGARGGNLQDMSTTRTQSAYGVFNNYEKQQVGKITKISVKSSNIEMAKFDVGSKIVVFARG